MLTAQRLLVGSRSESGPPQRERRDKIFADPPSHPSLVATRGSLFALADGLGDQLTAELAADRAITKVKEEYYYGDQSLDIPDALCRAVVAANLAVYELAQSDQSRSGMGTSFVAAVVYDDRAYLVGVGDCRAYITDEHKIRRLLTPLNVVPPIVERVEAATDRSWLPDSGPVQTRSLGREPTLEPVAIDVSLQPDETIVLCAIGLAGSVDDDEIRSIVTHFDPQRAADELARLVRERGGTKSLGVVVVGPQRTGTVGAKRQIRKLIPEIVAVVIFVAAAGAFAGYRLESAHAAATRMAIVQPTVTPLATDAIGGPLAASDSLTLGHIPTVSAGFASPDIPVDPTEEIGPTPTMVFIAGISTDTPEPTIARSTTVVMPAADSMTAIASTDTPTATSTVTIVPTGTPTQSATSVPTLTKTPGRPTSTATPASAYPALKPTPFASSPPTVSATPTALAALVLYPALSSNGTVTLSWTYNGAVTGDESFDIRVWGSTGGDPNTGVANVPSTGRSYQIGSGFVYGPGTYFWTVVLIRKSSTAIDTVAQADGQPLEFTWTPSPGKALRSP